MSAAPRRAQLGVTVEQYDAMLAAQGGGCAICGNPPKTRRLHVDHDHRTGRVRGLLCHRCNRTLASWVTAHWLHQAALYLGLSSATYSDPAQAHNDRMRGTHVESKTPAA